jgi:hypothetical protein
MPIAGGLFRCVSDRPLPQLNVLPFRNAHFNDPVYE